MNSDNFKNAVMLNKVSIVAPEELSNTYSEFEELMMDLVLIFIKVHCITSKIFR
jgi:hypothetical protein